MIGGAPDTLFVLGGVTFRHLEVPQSVPFGGKQRLGVHQLPGGIRVIDAMGADDRDITWSGLMLGSDATARAQQLDYFRKQGQPLSLTWSNFSYLVEIEEFKPDYERFYQISYAITLKVVADLSSPAPTLPPLVDDLISGDLANLLTSAIALGMTVPGSMPGTFSTTTGAPTPPPVMITAPVPGDALDLTDLAASMTTLQAAEIQVPTFVGTPPSTTQPVTGAISDTLDSVGDLLDEAGDTLAENGGAVGGVVAGGDPVAMAASFSSYADVATQAALIQPMSAYLTRMQTNIGQGAN